MNRRGLLIILSSPSGAGKSHSWPSGCATWDPGLSFSVSATTRAPRVGEVDGQDYHFTKEVDFKEMVADGDMLEHAHVFGNFYGSPKGPVEQVIDAGQDVLFDIDWQGAQQITQFGAWGRTHCRSSCCRLQSPSCAAVLKRAVRMIPIPSRAAWRKAGTRSAIGAVTTLFLSMTIWMKPRPA